MEEYILTLDLGTTNIKAGLYNSCLEEVSLVFSRVEYIKSKYFVEFDADNYWQVCKKSLLQVIKKSKINTKNIIAISLTGQAETLIIIDKNNDVLGNAISWMDTRSENECEVLKKVFDNKRSYMITGQPDIITNWPITKILWIKENQKVRFNNAKMFLLLKDFIIFKLTGKLASEYSTSSFTYYLDIIHKRYWKDIIDYVGFNLEKLPELMEPGENILGLTQETCKELKINKDILVNIGMLDHFSGMLGVGNIEEGILSESTGTVMALATILKKPNRNLFPLPFHYGPFQNTYSLLPVCESGGICYDWFKENFYPDSKFEEIDREIEKNLSFEESNQLLFLPYILGTNSPEFNQKAKGVFYGIKINNRKIDFARAVLEGIAFLLNKNIEFLKSKGINIKKIISLGGGSKSKVWNQMKADVTNKEIYIPKYRESTLFGSAICVTSKIYSLDYYNLARKNIKFLQKISPDKKNLQYYRNAYNKFIEIYSDIEDLF
jgi:sugar (pentulose or hexulose) kinase